MEETSNNANQMTNEKEKACYAPSKSIKNPLTLVGIKSRFTPINLIENSE